MNQNFIKIIVTGSNKGVGYGIVENLIQKQNYHIIMACRSLERGNEARKQLLQLQPEAMVDVLQLDISNEQSINNFIIQIGQKYGTIDILLNNSGIAFKGDQLDGEVVRQTFQTNFYGTVYLSEQMIPLINQKGKILIIGSSLGKTIHLKNENLKKQFKDQNLTKDGLFQLAKQFQENVDNNTYIQNGWPKNAYGMSKLCINTYANLLSNYDVIKQKQILVFSCCPGWVRTDMTGQQATRSIQEGSVCPCYIVELDHNVGQQLQGKFFYDQKVVEI
ncbi:hypothetical protein IMG5_060150 [Ichthyophthirius multifiliis]|uniref:Carbonyl reductase (NADPH) n=1 Tax=Ichthyophthirius multifiliis TaxID=5932 RepID=G0QNN1_ICHMU|nr:hypothetical protein IMG5_060150 [Ichthyophthirius multifiliis]EGR33176.1 hypothetical protein IMG5_060150 [Ichthyophthirius multifiliis]|eukprot:XP_004037162.1 hypothetical protein IMG5_060150 [Ichthyophthirius multifiliis]